MLPIWLLASVYRRLLVKLFWHNMLHQCVQKEILHRKFVNILLYDCVWSVIMDIINMYLRYRARNRGAHPMLGIFIAELEWFDRSVLNRKRIFSFHVSDIIFFVFGLLSASPPCMGYNNPLVVCALHKYIIQLLHSYAVEYLVFLPSLSLFSLSTAIVPVFMTASPKTCNLLSLCALREVFIVSCFCLIVSPVSHCLEWIVDIARWEGNGYFLSKNHKRRCKRLSYPLIGSKTSLDQNVHKHLCT